MRPAPRVQPSLRRVLLVWLLLPLVLLVPLSATLTWRLALAPALDGLDRALTDNAVALSRIVELRDGRPVLPLSAQTAQALVADVADQVFFAVGDDQGRLLGGDPALLAERARQPPLAAGQWRFFDSQLGGRPVRVALHALRCGGPAQTCAVLVAETLVKRDAAERALLWATLLGTLALALPMVALALLAVRHGMQPLQRAADEVAARTPDHLAPVDARTVPHEARGFVQALNTLFGRLRESAAVQRAFVADAAHQLRTPLTVLRLEAGQALDAPHPPELRPRLQRLHAAAERGARLAQQLLALARAEGAALDPDRRRQRIDLARLAADAADQWLPPALAAGQDLGFELAPAWVEGDPLLLGELLGNLVHNAIVHAGPGARVTVRTALADGAARLSVEDDGPGIDPADAQALWQRFRRGTQATGNGSGSGLGLAIVQDIARLHGGQAMLEPGAGGRGLTVSVVLPAVVPPPGAGPARTARADG